MYVLGKEERALSSTANLSTLPKLSERHAHNTLELGPGISPWGNGVRNLEFECLRTVSVTTLISSVCEVLSAVAFLDATHVVSLVVSCPRLSVTVGKRIHVEAASLVPEGLERIEPIGVS